MEDALRQVIKSHSNYWVDFLNLFCENPAQLKKFLPPCIDNLTCKIDEAADGVFMLFLTPTQAAQTVNAVCGISDFPYLAADFALKTLGRISAMPSFYQGANKVYGLSSQLLQDYHQKSILGSCSFGERYLVDHLHRSVAEIIIEDENGEQFTGSGVVVSLTSPLVKSCRILTCKHNLYSANGTRYKIIDVKVGDESFSPVNIFVCNEVDACCVVLDRIGNTFPLPLGNPHVLLPVITAGFPRTKLTSASPLLFHKGEINGISGTIEAGDMEMILSCDVAPGSSGGPVLSEYGAVLGLVTELVETAFLDGKAKFGVAIPSMQIVSELSFDKHGHSWRQDYIGNH